MSDERALPAIAPPVRKGGAETPRPENPGAQAIRSVLRAATDKREPPLLSVADLHVTLGRRGDGVKPVDGVGFQLSQGRTLGVVGESGSGKTMTALALMGLTPPPSIVKAWELTFKGVDLLTLRPRELTGLRGAEIAMIFQEPMTALNPVYTVGDQIVEALRLHAGLSASEARDRAVELLGKVGIPGAARRANSYPHHLSGGMCQRVVIAMALSCAPRILIADEPTTALDVTVQSQIVDLLLEMQEEHDMAMMFISHNLGLISEVSDDVAVLYAGQIAEIGPAEAVLGDPLHPYTKGLLKTLPRLGGRRKGGPRKLPVMEGAVPDPARRPQGCVFSARCPHADARCRAARPPLLEASRSRLVACIKADIPLDAHDVGGAAQGAPG